MKPDLYSYSKIENGVPTVHYFLQAREYIGWIATLDRSKITCDHTVTVFRCNEHDHTPKAKCSDLLECLSDNKYYLAEVVIRNAFAVHSYEEVSRCIPKTLMQRVDNYRMIIQKSKYIPLFYGIGWKN